MNRKILTIQDLYEYLINAKTNLIFQSNKSGFEISVSSSGCFEMIENRDDEGLVYCNLKAFHDLSNLNKSYIDSEVFRNHISSLKDRPIMADIIDIDDGHGGVIKDFSGHTMYYDDDQDKIVYNEIPVGHVINPENIRIQYDEEYQRNFAIADCIIYEEYTDACDILRRRNSVDCSVELVIRDMSFNAKLGELCINDFYVQGITLLGESVQPGMKGAHVTLKDFSKENNSIVFNKAELIDEITQAVMNQLDNHTAYAEKNNHGKEENAVDNFENEVKDTEVETTEEEAVVEIDDAVEDTPEVVEKFDDDGTGASDANNDSDTSDDTEDGTDDTEESDETEDVENTEPEEGSDEAENIHGDLNNGQNGKGKVFTKQFELSHDDIRCGLYALLSAYEESDNDWYWINSVFDDHFIYEGIFDASHLYDQKYSRNGDEIAFEGERVHMNKVIVTDSEYAQLNEMRSNYSSIVEKLAKYEAEPEKMEILNSLAYQSIADQNDFKEFMKQENHFDLSVEEVKNQADAMLLQYAKSGKLNFAKVNDKNEKEEPKKDFLAFARVERNTSFLDELLNKQ